MPSSAKSMLPTTCKRRKLVEPLAVRVHCRHGLESLVADELSALGARAAGDETVEATLQGPLESLWASRCMLRNGRDMIATGTLYFCNR